MITIFKTKSKFTKRVGIRVLFAVKLTLSQYHPYNESPISAQVENIILYAHSVALIENTTKGQRECLIATFESTEFSKIYPRKLKLLSILAEKFQSQNRIQVFSTN